MVFVHARKETVKTAEMLRTEATAEGIIDLFDPREHPKYDSFKREVGTSRNRELKELFNDGFGWVPYRSSCAAVETKSGGSIHHAGMLRSDRNLSERLFETNLTKVSQNPTPR
jgi:antiviral helicase SLH1